MLFGETVAVYCENHTELTNTLCGQNAESFGMLKQVVYIVTTGLYIVKCESQFLFTINPSKIEFILIIYKNSVRTSQETYYVSTTKPNRLMLFGETAAVYCENHTGHTDTLCGKNAGFWCVKVGGTYSNHRALKGSLVKHRNNFIYTLLYQP
jgi:translation initiation factor IF-1